MRRLARGFAYMALTGVSLWLHEGRAQGGDRITTRDLATLRDIGALSVSPDERWVVFEVVRADPDRNRYDTAWHLMAVDSLKTRYLADAGDLLPDVHLGRVSQHRMPPPPAWSPDGAAIVYLRRDEGSTQIWHIRRDREGAEQLTHNEADVRRAVFARDGRRVLFETERSQAEIEIALAVEGRTGFRYDERFQPVHDRIPVSPRDARFQIGGAQRETRSQKSLHVIWAYDFSSRRERRATTQERAEFAALTSQTQPESRPHFRLHSAASLRGALGWTEALDTERQGMQPSLTIVAKPVGAREPIVCSAAECTSNFVIGLWWRSEDELVFVRGEGRRGTDRALYAWRPHESIRPRLILRTADRFASPGCLVAQRRLLCIYEQPDRPNRLVGIDLDSGAIETLFDPNPDFARFDLGSPTQRIDIRGDSGAETYGYLVLPPHRSGERLPLVIVTYRCTGFLRGGAGDEYPIYPFAAEGFAVLCFETPDDLERMARLDAETYTRWWRGAGYPARHLVAETLVAAVTQLDQMGIVDPARVGISGLSFGAEIVGFALPHMPRLAAAIVSGHPGPGPAQYSLLGPVVRDALRSQGVGRPDETPERWREIGFSPHVHRIRTPLLVNAADHEMLAALDAVTSLEDAGRAVEMYVFPGEYHVKWQPAHRLAIYNRNMDWMNFWLRGVEDPVPAKAEQYARWRAMRVKQCELFKGDDAPWYCRQ